MSDTKYTSTKLIDLNNKITIIEQDYFGSTEEDILILYGTILSDTIRCIGENSDWKFEKSFRVFDDMFEIFVDRSQ